MKEGWEIKTLGEVCDILDKLRKPITKSDRVVGDYPYYGATGILSYVDHYIFSEDLVLLGEDGAKWGVGDRSAFIATGKYWVNNHAHVLKPKNDALEYNWLVHYLNGNDLTPFVTGMTVPKLTQEKMRSIPIPLPPLPVQQRIVSIIDKSFEAIDKAIENTQKNLQNAKELFESYLSSVSAEKVSLGSLVKITTGKLNSNASVEDGQYPFFTCSREVFAINHYAFDLEAILLAGNNASGDFNVKHFRGKFNAYQRTYVITIKNEEEISYRFLYFQLIKGLKEFKEMSVGANTKFLKIGMIEELKISLPSPSEQQVIVGKLEMLSEKTTTITIDYQQKIRDLEELKKSVLNKAFAGEL
jgi:type I restriction enzyme S subunit